MKVETQENPLSRLGLGQGLLHGGHELCPLFMERKVGQPSVNEELVVGQDVGDRPGMEKGPIRRVLVGRDKAGQHGSTLHVNHSCLLPSQGSYLVGTPRCQNFAVPDCHGLYDSPDLGLKRGVIHGYNLAVVNDHLGISQLLRQICTLGCSPLTAQNHCQGRSKQSLHVGYPRIGFHTLPFSSFRPSPLFKFGVILFNPKLLASPSGPSFESDLGTDWLLVEFLAELAAKNDHLPTHDRH